MRILLFWIISLSMLLSGEEPSQAKISLLAKKGEKIARTFCDPRKLPRTSGTIESLMEQIKASKACSHLSKNKIEALAYYLRGEAAEDTVKRLHVPHDAKCPVCGMFVSKYPKWAASMVIEGKRYYFDGVKDMMKYYIFDGDFPYDRKKISEMTVTDYYTLEAIPAREAWYVYDSDVFGPMGHELIPFKSKKSAESFVSDHHGKKIVKFDEISDRMVLALDGIELE